MILVTDGVGTSVKAAKKWDASFSYLSGGS